MASSSAAVSRKVCSFDELLARREAARQQGRTVVHCHGCFDVVHPGHIHHLQHARSLGDMLIVLGQHGSRSRALGIHGVTAVVLLGACVLTAVGQAPW